MGGAVLAGQDVVCLAHEPWHGPWKTYQQIMALMAESNRVLYVGPPSSLREAVRGLRNRLARPPVLERLSASLFAYHEPRLLARANEHRPFAALFNWPGSRLRLAQIRRLARRCGMTSPILWVFDPLMAYAIGAFREKLLVYHVLDDYVEFFSPDAVRLRATMAKNEEAVLRRADIVFAVSDALHRRCLEYNPNSFLVPNGVNYDLFQTVIAEGDVPADVRAIPGPVIGFVGAIQSTVDFSLLDRLSVERPGWSVLLVGPDEVGENRPQFEALLKRPNVHCLGRKAVRDVPRYINGCDVCLMPYRPDRGTVHDSDKIKVYEYLACGRPVVSTDIPSARKFAPLVRVARDASEFITLVGRSLHEEPYWPGLRKAAASEHSWQRRVELASRLIRERLSGGGAASRAGRTRPVRGSVLT